MSTLGETLYHPVNGTTEQTWDGFSWPGFLFGVIWLAVKQLWVHFIVSIVILVVTAGYGAIVIWFFYGFAGNDLHKKSLLKKGYLTKSQYDERSQKPAGDVFSGPFTTRPFSSSSAADELEKLAKLHSSGALTAEEFAAGKRKILSQ